MFCFIQPLSSDQWNADHNGYIVRYISVASANSSHEYAYIDDESASSYQLDGLACWTEYSLELAAYNEVGISNYSSTISVRTRESGTLFSCSTLLLCFWFDVELSLHIKRIASLLTVLGAFYIRARLGALYIIARLVQLEFSD